MNLPTLSLIVLLPLAASTALAAEDLYRSTVDLYRSTMPNGDIRYGESPAPGAKSVRKIPAPPVTTGTIVITPEDKARAAHIQPQTGGVTVMPTQTRPATTPAEAGSGATYGSGPGPLPQRAY